MSLGPVSGAHGSEEETNEETPAGQALELGLPEKEYEPGEMAGTDEPKTSEAEPSDGSVRLLLADEITTPSK